MKLKLTVDGKIYEVEVEVSEPEPPRPGYVPPAGQARASTPSAASAAAGVTARPAAGQVADEDKVCRSPISGVVVRVSAQAGQAIKPNDVLVVLEAMKMETVITAPIAGMIAKITAVPGEPVQRGEVLVEFE